MSQGMTEARRKMLEMLAHDRAAKAGKAMPWRMGR